MKNFTITCIVPALFDYGFHKNTCKVLGTVNAFRVIKELRAMKNAPVKMWATCE